MSYDHWKTRSDREDDDEIQPVRDELADAIDEIERLTRENDMLVAAAKELERKLYDAQRLLNGIRLLLG
jgi:hypothetical protein